MYIFLFIHCFNVSIFALATHVYITLHNIQGYIKIPKTNSKELKLQLEEISKSQNRSFNNLIITILKDFVKTN